MELWSLCIRYGEIFSMYDTIEFDSMDTDYCIEVNNKTIFINPENWTITSSHIYYQDDNVRIDLELI